MALVMLRRAVSKEVRLVVMEKGNGEDGGGGGDMAYISNADISLHLFFQPPLLPSTLHKPAPRPSRQTKSLTRKRNLEPTLSPPHLHVLLQSQSRAGGGTTYSKGLGALCQG